MRVVSARRIRNRREEIQGTTILVKVVAPGRLFGTQRVWRGSSQIELSDPVRTVVDLLDDPAMGGGIRHVAELVTAYFESAHRDDGRLSDCITRVGNRTAWKRLGYFIEALTIDAPGLVHRASESQSSGISLLDPAAPARGRALGHWNRRLNVEIKRSSP